MKKRLSLMMTDLNKIYVFHGDFKMLKFNLNNGKTLEVAKPDVVDHYSKLLPILCTHDLDDHHFRLLMNELQQPTEFESNLQFPLTLVCQLLKGITHFCNTEKQQLNATIDEIEKIDMLACQSEFLKVLLYYLQQDYKTCLSGCLSVYKKAYQQNLVSLLPSVEFIRGLCLVQLELYEKALDAFQKILRWAYHLEIDGLPIKIQIAVCYEALGLNKEAELACHNILATNSKNERALHLLSVILLKKSDKLGIVCLKKALEYSLRPDMGMISKLAEIYFLERSYEKSKILFQFVYDHSQTKKIKCLAAKGLGLIFHFEKQFDKARKMYKFMASETRDEPSVVYHAQLCLLDDKSPELFLNRIKKVENLLSSNNEALSISILFLKAWSHVEISLRLRKFELLDLKKTDEKRNHLIEFYNHLNHAQKSMDILFKIENCEKYFTENDLFRLQGRIYRMSNKPEALQYFHADGSNLQVVKDLTVYSALLFDQKRYSDCKCILGQIESILNQLKHQGNMLNILRFNQLRLLEVSDPKSAYSKYKDLLDSDLHEHGYFD
eukprot:NODE_33_length_36935_cov_1.609241.p3 type:complete len:552 gc:universal NODE_33_length_36935_cov_1.609241:11550-9895(-)